MERLADLARGTTLARQIHDALMTRILNGELPPGTRLRDNELAASFDASNSPVREALRLLAQDGLVQIAPYRGCVVRSISADELAELLDVRMALEVHAARLAATRLGSTELQQLEEVVQAHTQACAAGDWERASYADRRFHLLLAEGAGNRTLVRSLQEIDRLVCLARRTRLCGPSPAGQASCRAILQALQARSGERAAALIAEHITSSKEHMCEMLESDIPKGASS